MRRQLRNHVRTQPVVCLPILCRRKILESTIIGEFATRRKAELAVEHVVQECGVLRSDVFIQPAGRANSPGTHAAGADAKVAPEPEGDRSWKGRSKSPWISPASIQERSPA